MAIIPANTPEDTLQTGMDAAAWRAVLAVSPLLFKVTSNSMAPTYRTGEQVWIRPLSPGEPAPGQIVAYFCGRLITHRYFGSHRFRGDNSLLWDPPVPDDAVVGVVTGVQRGEKILPLAASIPWRTRLRRLRLQGRRIKELFRKFLMS